MKKILYIGVLGLLLSSCSATKTVGNVSRIGGSQTSLSGTKWIVSDDTPTDTKAYIDIDPNEGFSGNAGCNDFTSSNVGIHSDTGDFSVKNIALTRKICRNMNMNFEQNFVKMIEAADKYVVNGNSLSLYKGQLLLIKFQKQ